MSIAVICLGVNDYKDKLQLCVHRHIDEYLEDDEDDRSISMTDDRRTS